MNKTEKKLFKIKRLYFFYSKLKNEITQKENEIKSYQKNVSPEDNYYSKLILERQEQIEILEALQDRLLKIM